MSIRAEIQTEKAARKAVDGGARVKDARSSGVRELRSHDLHDGPCQCMISAKISFEAFRQGAGEAAAGDWTSFERGMALLSRAVERAAPVDRRPSAGAS